MWTIDEKKYRERRCLECVEQVHLSGDTILEIPVVEESSAKLVKKLLPASESTGLMRAVLDLTE